MQDSTTFHIVTFGCQMNVNDSSWLARRFVRKGWQEAPAGKADVIVVNTCSVREKPELKVRSALGQIRQETGASPRVLVAVAGCVAQQVGEGIFAWSPQVRLVAGSDGMGHIPDALDDLLRHPRKRISLLDFTARYEEREDADDTPAAPCEYVNIMQGCDNFCTYCIVPFTRGRQKSRATAAILEECRSLVARGAKEITLLGQNVNAFGLDRSADGTSFAELLERVSAIPGLARLRYVTPHPKDMDERDVACFARLGNLCPRLHLPMQAGSDRILQRMHRRYDSAGFLRLVEALKAAQPGMALSTDLIVGFPGETEDDFQATLDMVRRCGFVASYSFCYSDRPGTRASLFGDKIPADVQLDRLHRLQAVQEELSGAWLAGRVGGTTEVLLEGPSPHQDPAAAGDGTVTWQGRDPQGALVHTPLPAGDHTGVLLPVRIVGAHRHSLRARPLEETA